MKSQLKIIGKTIHLVSPTYKTSAFSHRSNKLISSVSGVSLAYNFRASSSVMHTTLILIGIPSDFCKLDIAGIGHIRSYLC